MWGRALRRGPIPALAALAISGSTAAALSQSRWTPIDRGAFSGHPWSLAMKGGKSRCYRLGTGEVGGPISDELSVCGDPLGRPISPWQEPLGSEYSNNSASIDLVITRSRVRSTRTLLQFLHANRHQKWVHRNTKRLTKAQARKAGLRRNFRWQVVPAVPEACITEAVLFDARGEKLRTIKTPCEG
jgi:hypothetical protein